MGTTARQYVFGYGSLLERRHEPAHGLSELTGFRRTWNVAMDNRQTIPGYKHYLDQAAFEADPVRELARLYVHVRGLFRKADDEDAEDAADPVQEACRQETAKLHAGDPENLRLWQTFMPHCLAEIEHVYRRLDVRFDHTHGTRTPRAAPLP